MHACGFTRRRVRRAVSEQMRAAADRGTPPPTVALSMIARWRLLTESRTLLRHDWGPEKFFGDGVWRHDPNTWPYDAKAVADEQRRRTG